MKNKCQNLRQYEVCSMHLVSVKLKARLIISQYFLASDVG